MLEVLDRIIPGKDGRTQYHYVLIDFLCHRRGGELRAGADAAEVAWATLEEIVRYDLEPVAIQIITKALKLG